MKLTNVTREHKSGGNSTWAQKTTHIRDEPFHPICMTLNLNQNINILKNVLTVGSRVERKMTNEGDRSMSWSPRVMRTRPPVLRTSLFSTGFRMGS